MPQVGLEHGTVLIIVLSPIPFVSNHAWVNKIDLTKVNFGKGKRVVVKGGILDSKYQITVPKIHEGGTDDPERP